MMMESSSSQSATCLRKKRCWWDAFFLTFVLVVTVSTFLYGVGVAIPRLMENHSWMLAMGLVGVLTWFTFAILANLYLIRFKSPFVTRIIAPEYLILEDAFLPEDVGADWSTCQVCQIRRPPKSWHCTICAQCVLRRDHHCQFTGICIGETNHVHFISLLFYLAIGGAYAFFCCAVRIGGESPWLVFLQSVTLYNLPFDFSWLALLLSILSIESLIALVHLLVYLALALQGKTFVEGKGCIVWTTLNCRNYSYGKLKEFLGPSPILQILFPVFATSCCAPKPSSSSLPEWYAGNERLEKDEEENGSITASHSSCQLESFKRDCKLIYAVD